MPPRSGSEWLIPREFGPKGRVLIQRKRTAESEHLVIIASPTSPMSICSPSRVVNGNGPERYAGDDGRGAHRSVCAYHPNLCRSRGLAYSPPPPRVAQIRLPAHTVRPTMRGDPRHSSGLHENSVAPGRVPDGARVGNQRGRRNYSFESMSDGRPLARSSSRQRH